jgi:hypothetical protein
MDPILALWSELVEQVIAPLDWHRPFGSFMTFSGGEK